MKLATIVFGIIIGWILFTMWSGIREMRYYVGSFEMLQTRLLIFDNYFDKIDTIYTLIDSKFESIQEAHQVRYHFIPKLSLVRTNINEIPSNTLFICIDKNNNSGIKYDSSLRFLDSISVNYFNYYILKK